MTSNKRKQSPTEQEEIPAHKKAKEDEEESEDEGELEDESKQSFVWTGEAMIEQQLAKRGMTVHRTEEGVRAVESKWNQEWAEDEWHGWMAAKYRMMAAKWAKKRLYFPSEFALWIFHQKSCAKLRWSTRTRAFAFPLFPPP